MADGIIYETIERRVVDNRVFLLGLDELYRDAMKRHEREELLKCARRVADALEVGPLNVPIEGYYSEDRQLTEYFRLVRALQEVDRSRASELATLREYGRLLEVTSAPIYGRPQHGLKLLPVGCDALSQALYDTQPNWTMARLIEAAYHVAVETDEISLVGLAARVKDPVVLAALRESVVLYAEVVAAAAPLLEREFEYVWKVDDDLAELARRFIDTFNALFEERLPPPDPAQAQWYWNEYEGIIIGRCARLGYDDSESPVQYYHWAICRGPKGLTVQEFWDPEIWTTERYLEALLRGKMPGALRNPGWDE